MSHNTVYHVCMAVFVFYVNVIECERGGGYLNAVGRGDLIAYMCGSQCQFCVCIAFSENLYVTERTTNTCLCVNFAYDTPESTANKFLKYYRVDILECG